MILLYFEKEVRQVKANNFRLDLSMCYLTSTSLFLFNILLLFQSIQSYISKRKV